MLKQQFIEKFSGGIEDFCTDYFKKLCWSDKDIEMFITRLRRVSQSALSECWDMAGAERNRYIEARNELLINYVRGLPIHGILKNNLIKFIQRFSIFKSSNSLTSQKEGKTE